VGWLIWRRAKQRAKMSRAMTRRATASTDGQDADRFTT
jgi:hypothetical protein